MGSFEYIRSTSVWSGKFFWYAWLAELKWCASMCVCVYEIKSVEGRGSQIWNKLDDMICAATLLVSADGAGFPINKHRKIIRTYLELGVLLHELLELELY